MAVLRMFNKYDRDQSGGIDVTELQRLLIDDMGERFFKTKKIPMADVFKTYNTNDDEVSLQMRTAPRFVLSNHACMYRQRQT
eukprot:SAG31_NODE_150_length_22290_cov_5.975801_8_plen_82_part_00